MPEILLLGVIGLAGVALAWWLLVTTEGVYLGRRVVVWLYDLYAHRYDRIKGFDPDDEAAFLGRYVFHALEGAPAALVLDVATGTGRLPLLLMEAPAFNGRVWGLDLSRRMLRVAAKKLAPYGQRTRLLWQAAESLPFVDAAFDMVTCLEALEFFTDQRAVLAEVARVLRPGGVLVTTRRLGRDAALMPGKALSEAKLAALLGALGLEGVAFYPWQMDYDIVLAQKTGAPSAGQGGVRPLEEALCCPACRAATLVETAGALRCEACGARYPIAGDGVILLHGVRAAR
ncbi:MAG: hypothetical protein Kow00120_30270 [Anaerolineae bacterium]